MAKRFRNFPEGIFFSHIGLPEPTASAARPPRSRHQSIRILVGPPATLDKSLYIFQIGVLAKQADVINIPVELSTIQTKTGRTPRIIHHVLSPSQQDNTAHGPSV